MHLSMETCVLRQLFGNEEAIRMIHKAGFDCFDFSFYDITDENQNMLDNNYYEYAIRLRKLMDSVGIICNQAHAPFNLTLQNYSPDLDNPLYAELIRSIEFASLLGAPQIVVHALGSEKQLPTNDFDFYFYKNLEKWAKRYNIKIGIENLFSEDSVTGTKEGRLGTPEELSNLLQRLPSEFFTAVIDVGHAAISGAEPSHFISDFPANMLGGLHIHDTDYKEDLHTLPYLGKHQWNNILQSLAEIHYNNDLTFEINQYVLNFDIDFLPEALKFAAQTGRYMIEKFEAYKQRYEVI